MKWISEERVLIVGLGLMGGSYARALKRLGFSVSAIDTDPGTIAWALDHGIIDDGSTTVDSVLVGQADVVIFGLYPHVFVQWIADNQELLKPGAMLTDVTGVKSCIVYQIQDMLRPDVEFIAAHPMAGREVYGVQNSDERIFHDANYIVVPTPKNTEDAIEWCRSLGMILGFNHIAVLTPEQHDDMIAFLSQLAHVIAVSLMACSDDKGLVDYTGDSFRDLTRIARINDKMWSELFMLNKEPLLKYMDRFISEFTKFRNMLEADDEDGMRAMMRLSTERRAWFDKRKE